MSGPGRPGSGGEHDLQAKYGNSKRANAFYDNQVLDYLTPEMREFIGATSLAFLSVDGIYRALGHEGRDDRSPQYTDHCFTGDYPTDLVDQTGRANTGQLSFLSEVR